MNNQRNILLAVLLTGLILFGWSTAFLFSVTTRLRMLEHDWLERPDPSRGRHEKD